MSLASAAFTAWAASQTIRERVHELDPAAALGNLRALAAAKNPHLRRLAVSGLAYIAGHPDQRDGQVISIS